MKLESFLANEKMYKTISIGISNRIDCQLPKDNIEMQINVVYKKTSKTI